MFTALVRMLVAVFLATGKVLTGAMAPAWMVVAASDGAVAVVQICDPAGRMVEGGAGMNRTALRAALAVAASLWVFPDFRAVLFRGVVAGRGGA